MSVETMAIVLHHSRSRGTDKVVLLGIANHDGDGGAWPSLATLAKYANVDKRNVREALRRLEAAGEIRTLMNAGGTHHTAPHERPNRYEVLVCCPHDCDRTKNHGQRQEVQPAAGGGMPASGGGGMPASGGGGMPASGGGGMPASPEPSFEPSIEKTSSSYSSVTSPWDQAEPKGQEEESSLETDAELDTRALDLIASLPAINGSRLSTKFAPRIDDLLSGGWTREAIYRNLTTGTNGANSAGIYASKLKDLPTQPPARTPAPEATPRHPRTPYAPIKSHEELGVTRCEHARVKAICPRCSGLNLKPQARTDRDTVLAMISFFADSPNI